MVPTFIVAADLASGHLQPVLTDFHPSPLTIYALYPVNRHLSAKVTVFTEFLQQRLDGLPIYPLE